MALVARFGRTRAALALTAGLGVLALALALAAPGEGAPRVALTAAGGSLSLSNSAEGTAILRASDMRPGQEASGSVRIGNTGTVPAQLQLAPTSPVDSPGIGGGRLWDRLQLVVVDVTDARAPETLYAGTISAMGSVPAGTLAAGAERTYVVSASLPPAGAADNAYQGAGLSTAFTWTALAPDAATPTPTATPTASPTPSATPSAVPAPVPTPPPGAAGIPDPLAAGAVFQLPPARTCIAGRRITLRIRRPAGVTFRAIRISVNGRTRLRLRGARARSVRPTVTLRRLPAGRIRVTIRATTSTGRTIVARRTYNSCAQNPKGQASPQDGRPSPQAAALRVRAVSAARAGRPSPQRRPSPRPPSRS